ncbi:MAG TPA: DUF1343 domain-containing protein [Gemmatimonadaceae bacterium]|nr:DUF1343 domain-containing protein [Gemmatimonadaceae bacterium]
MSFGSRTSLATSAIAILALLTGATTVPLHAQGRVRLGIEVLLSDSVHLIRGKRVGLITNHSGITPDGRSSIDLLHRARDVRLTALFAPEHGIRGQAAAGERIATTVDSATGVPVYSLYGETRVPSAEMLKDVDVLLYDIQDVGARVYTFQWTMALSAEAAGKLGRPFIVLDRPNPVRGDVVEGGVLDSTFRSFVGQFPVALRYGLTPGELLRYLVGTGQVKADIKVVPMSGYRRDMWWEETGLPWRNPSPNIRTPDAALLYTGTVLVEGTNLSEGRGTAFPFQLIGAGWLNDAGAIARELNRRRIPGVVFDSTIVTVEEGQKWGGQRIPMIAIAVSDRTEVRPYRIGLELLREIYQRHKGEFQWRINSIDRLSGSIRFREAVELGLLESLIPELQRESLRFQEQTAPYLLYPRR